MPVCISLLGEYISYWTNKYNCPGFVFVPRKPWPFVKDYYNICCGLSGMLYTFGLEKGKDD